MKNKEKTKKFKRRRMVSTFSLLMSGITLIFCSLMLVGTSFAWFTVNIQNNGNKILSGNVDVSLWEEETYMSDTQKANATKITRAGYESYYDISDSEIGIFQYSLWEPGYSNKKTFVVANNGDLTLNYKLTFNISNETPGTDPTSNMDSVLSNLLKVYCNDTYIGTLGEVVENPFDSGNLEPGLISQEINLVIKMPDLVGNEYQGSSIEFDIRLIAAQSESEDENEEENLGWSKAKSQSVFGIPNSDGLTLSVSGVTINFNSTQILENGIENATLKVEKLTNNPNLELVEKLNIANTYDIDVVDQTGNSIDSITPIKGTLKLEANLPGLKLYHNDTLMIKTSSLVELESNISSDTYYYDTSTGLLTFYASTFSPFTICYNTVTWVDGSVIGTKNNPVKVYSEDGWYYLLNELGTYNESTKVTTLGNSEKTTYIEILADLDLTSVVLPTKYEIKNINLNGNDKSISGVTQSIFGKSGKVTGNSTISNLTINNSSSSDGLISNELTGTTTFNNVNIVSAIVKDGAFSCKGENVVFNNCIADSITVTRNEGESIGGFIGCAKNVTINSSIIKNSGIVSDKVTSGFVGISDTFTIHDSTIDNTTIKTTGDFTYVSPFSYVNNGNDIDDGTNTFNGSLESNLGYLNKNGLDSVSWKNLSNNVSLEFSISNQGLVTVTGISPYAKIVCYEELVLDRYLNGKLYHMNIEKNVLKVIDTTNATFTIPLVAKVINVTSKYYEALSNGISELPLGLEFEDNNVLFDNGTAYIDSSEDSNKYMYLSSDTNLIKVYFEVYDENDNLIYIESKTYQTN